MVQKDQKCCFSVKIYIDLIIIINIKVRPIKLCMGLSPKYCSQFVQIGPVNNNYCLKVSCSLRIKILTSYLKEINLITEYNIQWKWLVALYFSITNQSESLSKVFTVLLNYVLITR